MVTPPPPATVGPLVPEPLWLWPETGSNRVSVVCRLCANQRCRLVWTSSPWAYCRKPTTRVLSVIFSLVVGRRQHVVFVRAEVGRVGGHQLGVLVGVEQHGYFVLVADGAAARLHADDQAVTGIDVHHLELEFCFSHPSAHLPGPSCLFTLRRTCDSHRASASPGAHWPHAQPSRLVFSTNIRCALGASAPPPTGQLEESPQPSGQFSTMKLWLSLPSMLVVQRTSAAGMVPLWPSSS